MLNEFRQSETMQKSSLPQEKKRKKMTLQLLQLLQLLIKKSSAV